MSEIFLALAMLSLGIERFVTNWHPAISGVLCIITGVLMLIGR